MTGPERDLRPHPATTRTPEQFARMLGTDVLEREGLRRAVAAVLELLESQEGARSREWQGLDLGELVTHAIGHGDEVEHRASARDDATGALHAALAATRWLMVLARCIELDGGEG